MKRRKYQQTRRAEKSGETRQRIVQAAMELHEELGPALTSIKAIAEQAGVQRLTVYRHFPDEFSLFKACTSHWLGLHPLPAVSDRADYEDPLDLTAKVLQDFYRHYRSNERMWWVAYRDVDDVEALQEPMAAVEAYLDQVRDELVAAWKIKPEARNTLVLTLRHALRFMTCQSFKKEKLSDKKMVALLVNWLTD